jgi:phosphate transport system protein
MSRVVDPVLEDLRHKLLRMGVLAEEVLEKSVRAVWERDAALAEEVRTDDLAVDRLDVEIDETVLRALALQAPVANDLRAVLAAKMIATDLERVGDLARNIAKSASRLAERPPVELPAAMQALSDEARRLLRQALDSFSDGDVPRAKDVLAADDQVDLDQDRVIRDAIEWIEAHPASAGQGVDHVLIAKNLERVADHATNIAEDVILLVENRNLKHASKLAS